MSSNWKFTEYGKINISFSREKLIDLCVEKIGVQTGPFGTQLHQEDYVRKGTPIITVEHLGDNRILHENTPFVSDQDKSRLSNYHLREGDIVFSRVGSVDRSALVRKAEEGWLFSGRCLRVRVDTSKIDPIYLSYYFGTEGFKNYIRNIAVGATMPSINTKILSNVPIYFPSLEKQKKIAEILYSIDEKIELNSKINQTLEQMAQAIFKSWFVDFDPVKAKIEAKEKSEDTERAAMCAINGKPDAELEQLAPEQFQQLTATAALFPNELEESELGLIPKGWRVRSFTDGVDVIGGGTPKTSNPEYWGGDVLWFSVVDTPAPGEVFVISTEKTITREGVNNSSTHVLPVGTTIISARGTVGNLALVGVPMAMNQSCYGLHDRRGELGHYLYFATDAVVKTLRQRTHGSVFNTITRDTLNGVRAVAPPDVAVYTFERIVSGLMMRVLSALHESRTLAIIRDTLLPKLLSGELSV